MEVPEAIGHDCGGLRPRALAVEAAPELPDPNECGIDHVVVLMVENRSFDHYPR